MKIKRKKYSFLVIIPTFACNFNCTYCYSLKSGKSLKKENLEEILRIIKKIKPKHIQFHGGEPLLNFEFIKELCNSLGDKYSYSIQTNGSLLTEEVAAFLKEFNFSVGLSLDGPKKINDKVRKTLNGKSAYECVMRGVRALKKEKVRFSMICTISKANVLYPLEILKVAKKLGVRVLRTNLMIPFEWNIKHIPSSKSLYNFFMKAFDYYARKYSSYFRYETFYEFCRRTLMIDEYFSLCSRSPCGAGVELLVYSPDGFYPCPRLENKRYLFKDYSKVSSFMKNTYEKIFERKCGSCPINFLCKGVCRAYLESEYFGVYCSFLKKLFPTLSYRLYSGRYTKALSRGGIKIERLKVK